MQVFEPAREIAAAVASSGSGVRPVSTTAAPSAANLRATAAPMPRPAPVTTATWVDNGFNSFNSHLDRNLAWVSIHQLCPFRHLTKRGQWGAWAPTCHQRGTYL